MSFDQLSIKYGYLGILMLQTVDGTTSIHIFQDDEWVFVSYGENELDVIADADEVLKEWLV